jgi:uncharacterized membrane protein
MSTFDVFAIIFLTVAGVGVLLMLVDVLTNEYLPTLVAGVIVLLIGVLGLSATAITYTTTFHNGCEEAGGIVIDTSCVDSSVVGTFEYGDIVQIEVKN